jgi:IS30 family transposase
LLALLPTYEPVPTTTSALDPGHPSLFVQSRGALRRELQRYLRTGRAMRYPRGKRLPQGRGQLRDTVHISQRPAEAADRAVPGHWEGDLVFGKRPSAVGTLVERHSRYVLLFRLPDGFTAERMRPELTTAVLRLPEQLRRSLTWDQGREMAEHLQFTIDSGVQVYFCDPRSPWQRGTNENTNGLLRQYLSKPKLRGLILPNALWRKESRHSTIQNVASKYA